MRTRIDDAIVPGTVLHVFRRSIVRNLAILFLLWTAIDLVNVQLCASDRIDTASLPSSVSASPAARNGTEVPALPAPDDCFCCSHSVWPATALVSIPSAPVVTRPDPVGQQPLLALSSPLDHPPQIAL